MIIAPNTFVRLKRDPTCAGILLEGDKSVAGSKMVQVRLAVGQVKWLPYSALEPVPSAPETLVDRFADATQELAACSSAVGSSRRRWTEAKKRRIVAETR